MSSETLKIQLSASDEQWRFINSETRYTLMSGGFGAGKSYALAYKTVMRCIENPGLNGMVIASDYGRLSRDFIPVLFNVLDASGITYEWEKAPIPGTSARAMMIGEGWINHRLLVGSMDKPDSIKGPTLSHIELEEATLIPRRIPGKDETTWSVMVSRLRAPGGTNTIDASGTPEGIGNWTNDSGLFWRPPARVAEHDVWRSDFGVIVASSRSNLHNPAGYVDKMLASMTPTQAREKVDGYPAAGAAGQAYRDFVYERNVRRVRYDPFRGEVICGMDFNLAPMTATLMQQDRSGAIGIFAEIVLQHSTTRAMAQEICRRAKLLKIDPDRIKIYPDASGRARRTTGESDFDVLRAEGLRRLIYPKSGNPYVSERLNCMNAALYHGRLIVDPSCEGVITDLTQVSVNDYGELVKSNPALTHLTDGIGYVVTRLQPIRAGKGGLARAA